MVPARRHRVAVLVLPGVIPLELGTATQVFGRDPRLRPDRLRRRSTGTGAQIRAQHHDHHRARGARAGADRDRPGIRHARRRRVAGCPGRSASRGPSWRTPRLHLHRSLRACRGRTPRRAPSHHPLALDRRTRSPAPPGPRAAEPPLRRRRRRSQLRRCHRRRRPVPAPRATRPRGRSRQHRACALVAPPQRQGGQAQFIERLRPDATGDQLGPLRDWMLQNLALRLDLDTLAARAHLSRRTLTRRFRDETGLAPMAWLADACIHRARELLETTTEPVEHIGRLTGLGVPASVRAAFHRRLGTSPQEYRATFRHGCQRPQRRADENAMRRSASMPAVAELASVIEEALLDLGECCPRPVVVLRGHRR